MILTCYVYTKCILYNIIQIHVLFFTKRMRIEVDGNKKIKRRYKICTYYILWNVRVGVWTYNTSYWSGYSIAVVTYCGHVQSTWMIINIAGRSFYINTTHSTFFRWIPICAEIINARIKYRYTRYIIPIDTRLMRGTINNHFAALIH